MRAYVTVRAPSGQLHELVHGDVIGRLESAGLHIDDGRISEAHAMVSLRDGVMRLVRLRGAFAVNGRQLDEVELTPGQQVDLAPGVCIELIEVWLPEQVLGWSSDRGPRVVPPVASISDGRVLAGWRAGAEAWLWCTGPAWTVRRGDQHRPLEPGMQVAGIDFVAVELSHAGGQATRQGGHTSPLRLIAFYDTVHVHRAGRQVLVLSGVLARIVSELVAVDGPLGWATLAGEIWPDAEDAQVARARLDANLSRIRRKLRAAGIRADLVSSDGAGQIALLRYPEDTVEDRT